MAGATLLHPHPVLALWGPEEANKTALSAREGRTTRRKHHGKAAWIRGSAVRVADPFPAGDTRLPSCSSRRPVPKNVSQVKWRDAVLRNRLFLYTLSLDKAIAWQLPPPDLMTSVPQDRSLAGSTHF